MRRPRFRPRSRPRSACSSALLNMLTSPASLRLYLASGAVATGRASRQGRRKGLNGPKCPKRAARHRRVEVSVQPSVEVRVEGAGARWEGNSPNRERPSVPDGKFFGSGARIGNLTGKVTGNPEAHDRRAVANGGFGRQL